MPFLLQSDDTDRPGAARSSELEDRDCGNNEFPFVDTKIVKDQLLSAECS